MHNMGLKWPVFISYDMDECFFAESLKEMFFYHFLFQIVFKYVVFDHKSFRLFFLPYFINKHSFLYFYISFTHLGLKWPVFIPYIISIMPEWLFAESWNKCIYSLLFQVYIKYLVFDFHKSFCFYLSFLHFIYIYKKIINFTHESQMTHIGSFYWLIFVFASRNIFAAENYSHAPHFTTQHGCFCIIDAFRLTL